MPFPRPTRLLVLAMIGVAPLAAQAQKSAPSPGQPPSGQQEQQACPANFRGHSGGEPLTCQCSAQAVAENATVWGDWIYTDDSSICRAARHAGVVGPEGGSVTVLAEPGRQSYPGSTQNGVTSSSYGTWESSFRFDAKPPALATRPTK